VIGSWDFSQCNGDKEKELRRPEAGIIVNYVPLVTEGNMEMSTVDGTTVRLFY